MSEASNLPDHIRLAAEQAGLGKALTLFPEGVIAAYERGLRPVGDHPGIAPTSSPAPTFDPSRFERNP
jgi:hypothetical protein